MLERRTEYKIICLLCGQQEQSAEPKEKNALSKIIDLIHDEFAFDGYLDDGVEDVNMGKPKAYFHAWCLYRQ